MHKIKEIFSLSIPSLIVIVLPYLGLHWSVISQSVYFSNFILALFILLLIPFQIFFAKLFMSRNTLLQILSVGLLSATILFFYGINLVDIYFRWQIKAYHHQVVRNRIPFTIFFILLFLLEFFIFSRKRKLFFVQNTFFMVLLAVSIATLIFSSTHFKTTDYFKSDFKKEIQPIDSINKPILLIISDEYNSPDGLYQVFKDSSIYNYSNHLKNKGWIVRNSFYSHEISTIHSLSSLFNFNLSTDPNFAEINVNTIGPKKIMQSALNDSLTKKHINIVNFGIFDFGNTQPLTRLYYFPKSFLEELLRFTAFPLLSSNTDGFKAHGIKNNFFIESEHNRIILNSLIDTTQKLKNKLSFFYVHLYMPHAPLVYMPEFSYRVTELDNYLAFWKFTNSKLQTLLDPIVAENKFRIILTGDHGYRKSGKIDPRNSFTAFYGFDQKDVDQLKSVQDIGSLVNGYFK